MTDIEAAFLCLKSDLAIRPIYHQVAHRVEAHILVAFLAYCLTVTLKKQLAVHAPGLTPRRTAKTLLPPDARRALTDHRRTGAGHAVLHTTGKGASGITGKTGIEPATATAAAHLRADILHPGGDDVVETWQIPLIRNQ